MSGFLTNGLPRLPQIDPEVRVNVDTEFPRGLAPQSVAASAFQIATALGDCLLNCTPDVGGAAFSDTLGGMIATCPLFTHPGQLYHFDLRNKLVDEEYLEQDRTPEVGIYSGTNTGGRAPRSTQALMILQRAWPMPGRVVWTWRNMGNTPLNGTMLILWHL